MKNVLLKAMLKEVIDLVAVGKAAAAKNYSGLFSALIGAGEDIPAIVANWADLKPELEALLQDPLADADILAYAASLLAGENEKAVKVVFASADLLLALGSKGYALYLAIEGINAPPAAPAPVAGEP